MPAESAKNVAMTHKGKKLPFTPFAEINTSHEGEWKVEVARVAAKLLDLKG